MYEDVEGTVTFTGGTLALTGAALNVQWLIVVALLAVIAGVTLLRVAKR
ncbi:MAG TPA: hypothetical protein VFO65_11165 [Acidimicrobiales bacterium]|nr:hypothetical protein [Acidimicrobiales bacterium]